ncbi:CWC16 protein [Xylariales sp. AK1849]|nr:CWC16 protein [Xylariales sp. AK1849]
MGRYVPPDVEGTTSANALHKKHALGSRASKLASQGILTVRFEMPFAVWCSHCAKPTIIGQGVRFNAEKKRVGSYFSSPIFSFRMKHNVCGGAIEIRTDPKDTAYVVVEGGKKRDTGEDKEASEGEIKILTEKEREGLRSNAFAKLEKTIEDREQLIQAKARIEEIEEAQRTGWEDPYEVNRKLRREFRLGRHQRERDGKATEDLKDRMSLGTDLLPASEQDAKRAALVDFGPSAEGAMVGKALSKPLFERVFPKASTPPMNGKKRLKSEIASSQMRGNLVSEIVGNTRVSQDPFLVQDRTSMAPKAPVRISGVKRRRVIIEENQEPGEQMERDRKTANTNVPSTALVNYGSESE